MANQAQVRSWERLPDENQHEWELFEAFKNEYRSVPALIRGVYPDNDINATKVYVNSVARKFKWKDRCADYDRWISRQQDDATRKAVQEVARTATDQIIEIVDDLMSKYRTVSKKVGKKLEDQNDQEVHLGLVQMLTTVGKGIISEYEKLQRYLPDDAGKPQEQYADRLEGAAARMAAIMEEQARKSADNKEVLQ